MALTFKRGQEGRPPKSRLNPAMDARAQKTLVYLKTFLDTDQANKIWMAGQRIHDLNERMLYYRQVVMEVEEKVLGVPQPDKTDDYAVYKWKPVGIREFIISKEYLGKADEIYPAVLDAAEELNNGNYVEAILTGGIGCLPADTEFLSESGWVRMDAWEGQSVGQYNPTSGVVSMVQPTEYINLPSTGFWEFRNKRTLSMRLSSEHRMLLTSYTGKRQVVTAGSLAYKGVGGNSVPCTFRASREGVGFTDDQIRLMVAVAADGNFHPYVRQDGTKRCRITVRRDRKKKRIRELLAACGLDYKEQVSSKSRPTEVTFWFQSPVEEKTFDSFWKCNQPQLQVIFEEMPYWDGLFDHEGEWRFHTTVKANADFAQYMCHALGHKASVRVRTTESRGGRAPLYVVQAVNALDQDRKLEEEPVWLRGVVGERRYCFVVPTGFFVVRDRGSVFITGNSGKTTLALYTSAYQLYLLSCMRSPHRLYGLDPSSEILMIFQSITKKLAQGVDYQRFRSMIEGSPYFCDRFPFNKGLESMLVFPNRIEVHPVSGSETAAIGQNVIGGLIDELNYMAVVEKSKASVDKGTYDQAVSVYNSIARRRKSRFLEAGKMPGILCLVSSKKYPGQFTDLKMAEAEKDPSIYVYDKRVWDIKPDSFTKGWFHVFAGDTTRKPRILVENEKVSDQDREHVVSVPTEFRVDFEKDIINALREIAGVSTLARHPFFMEVDKVHAAFKPSIKSIFSQTPVDFVQTRLGLIKANFFRPDLPRFIHLDLAVTGDSAGMAIGTVIDFVGVGGQFQKDAFMPVIRMDGVLEIRPPKNSEILFTKIREVIFALRKMGMNVRWVTLDQFQSVDTQQILRQQGMLTGQQSIDAVPCRPYDMMKGAMYEGRLLMPENDHLKKEILMLEKDAKTGKVDHPPGFSKDCADGVAGVVYGLTMRREVWSSFNIPVTMVPNVVFSTKDVIQAKNTDTSGYQEEYNDSSESTTRSVV